MPLAEHLASEQAREDVRRLIHESVGYLRVGHGTWNLGSDGAWKTVIYHSNATQQDHTAYYRPDGDRYVVTDLGEGVRALRLRTGESAYGPATGVAMLEKLKLYDAEHPRNALGGMAHELELIGVQQADLPDAICRVMLASLKVAGGT